jgi:hypothetical protein
MVAQRLVTGNLEEAAQIVPGLAGVTLVDGYGRAFGDLLLVLTAITVVTAVVVFIFLGRGASEEASGDSGTAPEKDCLETA